MEQHKIPDRMSPTAEDFTRKDRAAAVLLNQLAPVVSKLRLAFSNGRRRSPAIAEYRRFNEQIQGLLPEYRRVQQELIEAWKKWQHDMLETFQRDGLLSAGNERDYLATALSSNERFLELQRLFHDKMRDLRMLIDGESTSTAEVEAEKTQARAFIETLEAEMERSIGQLEAHERSITATFRR